MARIDIRLGQRSDSRRRLQRVEALARAAGQEGRRLQALLVWGEALLNEGRRDEALALMHWLAEHPGLDQAEHMALRRQIQALGAAPGSPWAHDLEASVARMLADGA
jgi:hypothetical protein